MNDTPVHRPSPVYFLHDAEVLPGRIGALETLHQVVDVVVPRHPGMGEHDDEMIARWDSIRDLAQHHVEQVRKLIGGARVQLMGAGFGGWIAMEMALMAKELFSSLTLIAPYGVKFSGPMEPEFADILLLDVAELLELGWADPSTAHGIRLPGYPAELTDAENARVFADRAALSRFGWKPFMHDPHLRRWLHAIDLPTLVVCGLDDGIVPATHSRQVAEEMPNASLVEIPSCGHYPYLEAPEAFLDAVVPFLSQTELAGSIK